MSDLHKTLGVALKQIRFGSDARERVLKGVRSARNEKVTSAKVLSLTDRHKGLALQSLDPTSERSGSRIATYCRLHSPDGLVFDCASYSGSAGLELRLQCGTQPPIWVQRVGSLARAKELAKAWRSELSSRRRWTEL